MEVQTEPLFHAGSGHQPGSLTTTAQKLPRVLTERDRQPSAVLATSNNGMHVLFAINTIHRYTYFESMIRALCHRGHTVELVHYGSDLPGGSDAAAASAEQGIPGLSIGEAQRRTGFWRKVLFGSREVRAYASYASRSDQDPFYISRQQRYLPRPIKKLVETIPLLNRLFALRPVRWALTLVEKLSPADGAVVRHIKEVSPDVVVAAPALMRFSEEIEYIKAAKSLGIPSIIPVFSWDALTTKGLIQVAPDLTLVWNGSQAEEAMRVHGLHEPGIAVIGSLFLDKWFDDSRLVLSETELRQSVGLNADEQYILYLGSTVNIAPDESWLIEELANALDRSDDSRLHSMTILARPHGSHQRPFETLSHPRVHAWTRDELLPDSPEGFAAFAAAIKHAVVVIGINTTAMVDSVIAGKPVITAQIGEFRDTNASRAVHYRHIVDSGVYETADNVEDCLRIIARLLDGGDEKSKIRRSFVERYIRPHGIDTSAGEVAAQAIEIAAKGIRTDGIPQANIR